MMAQEFYNAVVKMRKAQKDYTRLSSTRNAVLKDQYERIVDNEIQRVEKIKAEEARKQQQVLL